MQKPEWSLIVFTIMFQSAAGFVVFTALTHFCSASNLTLYNSMIGQLGYIFIPFIIIGILFSFSHLENPKNAFLSLNNLSHSWLSREILFLILFSISSALFFILSILGTAYLFLVDLILVFSFAAGLGLIFSMAKLYMLKTVPAWNTQYTVKSFFITSLLLGILGVQLSFRYTNFYFHIILFLELILLILQIEIIFQSINRLNKHSVTLKRSFKVNNEFIRRVFIIRFLFLVLAILLIAYLNFSEANLIVMYIASILILISEILGRYLFYTFYRRYGV